jgi:hypothetical protein
VVTAIKPIAIKKEKPEEKYEDKNGAISSR